MALSKEVYRSRLASARQRLTALNADGLVATPSSNLFYLTGIDFHRSERLTALFLFKDRDPFVLCPLFEEARLRGMSAVEEVHSWKETEDPFRKAGALFPAGKGMLAVEPSRLSVAALKSPRRSPPPPPPPVRSLSPRVWAPPRPASP